MHHTEGAPGNRATLRHGTKSTAIRPRLAKEY